MLKLVILINFLLLVISLFSSLFLVYKDRGKGSRVLMALSTRVGLALSLLALIAYGLYSGQIGSRAPWDAFLNEADLKKQQRTVTNSADTVKPVEISVEKTNP